MKKTELMLPSRCTANLPDDLTKPYYIAEEKIDGSRYVLYIGGDPYERRTKHTLLSRRVSVTDGKHVDRTDNVPHITHELYEGLEGTILDGEIVAADFLSTNSIMNSGPALAVSKQKQIGPCTYRVFDVMAFRGKDVRTLPLSQRRKVLEEVVRRMNNEHVIAIPQITTDLEAYFTEIVSKGGEGVIIKDLRSAYGVGWAKMKKSYDVSCVITGVKPGNGKYASSIGAIAVSVYHAKRLVEIGFASGFDDRLRNDIANNFENYEGRVVDIFTQEILKTKDGIGRLRHPTFFRLRDDLNAEDCTSEKLWADLKAAKTRNRRSKFDE